MVYRRRNKKRTYKKKMYKRKMMRRRGGIQKYDGQAKFKIHTTIDITADAGSKGYLVVNWAGNSIAAGTTTARLTVQNEFTQFNSRYAFYKVVGCKIKINPVLPQAGGLLTVGPIISGTNPQGLPNNVTPLAEFQSYMDYKSTAPGRPLYKWLNCSKFFKKNVNFGASNIDWMTVTQNYPDIGTMVYLDNVGYALGARMAVAEIIWYVKFKGPHL